MSRYVENRTGAREKVQIDEALGAQAAIMVILNNLGRRSDEVSVFLDSAIELEEIYGSDSPVTVALLEAGNLGPRIDHEIARLRVFLETRTGYLLTAQRGKK